MVFAGDFVPEGDQVVVLELEESVALCAVKMVVLWIAIIVLVDCPAVEDELAKQTGIDELVEGAIDGGAADVPLLA
jgi:hypothetical protein